MSDYLETALRFGPETLARDTQRTNYLIATYSGPTWYVNPDDSDAYSTINEASAAADAELAAGEPIIINLAPGKTHTLTGGSFSPVVSRDTYIIVNIPRDGGVYLQNNTEVVGNITLASASAEIVRRHLGFCNIYLNGSFSGQSKWNIYMENSIMGGAITRTHGADGCFLYQSNVAHNSSFTDLDANSSGGDGYWYAFNCSYGFSNPANTITFVNGSRIRMFNCYFSGYPSAAINLFDFGGGTNYVDFFNHNIFNIQPHSGGVTIVSNAGGGSMTAYGRTEFRFMGNNDVSVDFGAGISSADNPGYFFMSTDEDNSRAFPLNPPEGLIWADGRTGEFLCYDSGDWCVGDLKRKEIWLGIGGAAADHDLGWNVPTGAAVIKTAICLRKSLTGAAGATKAGLGTKAAGDPDKYLLTGSLSANARIQGIHGTWNDGTGDDLAITGCDNAGNASGTLAGSGSEDAQIIVWYRQADQLPL